MERQIASFENLKERGRMVRAVWLSDLEDAEDLLALLGGDVCIHGYTVMEWDSFQHHLPDAEGALQPLPTQTAIHQFCAVCRVSEEPFSACAFPYGPESVVWLEQNLPPWVLRRIVRVADELSGWKENWDPFGGQRKGGAKPASAGGS